MKKRHRDVKPKVRNLEYYQYRFRWVPNKVVESKFKRHRWMLEMLDIGLKKPDECHLGYFNFLCVKLYEIGEPAIRQVVEGAGVSLYQFVNEHEERKKKRALGA